MSAARADVSPSVVAHCDRKMNRAQRRALTKKQKSAKAPVASDINPRGPQRLCLSMIIRDEGKTLQRCLDSVRTVIDEAVLLVDARSQDDSLDIARRFVNEVGGTCKEFSFEDFADMTAEEIAEKYPDPIRNPNGGFSGARNYAASLATCDWQFQMDGHEVLESPDEFMRMRGWLCKHTEFKAQGTHDDRTYALHSRDVVSVSISLRMMGNEGDAQFLQNRLWDRSKCKYHGLVHNRLEPCDEKNSIGFGHVRLLHLPHQENRHARRGQRNSMVPKVCDAQLICEPHNGKALYYSGVHAQDCGDNEAAVGFYERYLGVNPKTGKQISEHPFERVLIWWHGFRGLVRLAIDSGEVAVPEEMKAMLGESAQ